MKKTVLIVALISSFRALTIYAADQSDERLLRETVQLSREIKEFEKTLGLKPTDTLSRGYNEPGVQPMSLTYIWAQRCGTLATRRPVDLMIGLAFGNITGNMPLKQLYVQNQEEYSVYVRVADNFSVGAYITENLAKQNLYLRVATILHEDIHSNLPGVPEFDNEAVTTALGFLAAQEYFDRKSNAENGLKIYLAVNYCRKASRELNELVRILEEKVFSGPGALDSKRRIALKLVYATVAYGGMYSEEAGDRPGEILEAKISHDFMYWKYFDDTAGIYENMCDWPDGPKGLPELIQELNAMPKDYAGGFPKYIEALRQKYGYSPKPAFTN